jgi:hypothetical protein
MSEPEWGPEERPPAARPGKANWILAGLVGLVGVVAFIVATQTGRRDSALLFVGLPVLLAVALVLTPGRTTHGRVFQATTVVLLLAAVALHEGAICVILAAPLVYAVAHGATALIHWIRRTSRPYALLPLPLLVLSAGFEGTSPQLRIEPDQSVEVRRVVALTPDEVRAHLAAGPHPAGLRSVPLRLLGMPTPERVVGDGLDPGDRWLFHYAGSAHGPGGHTVAQVSVRAADHIDFDVVEDSAITARWFQWRHASIGWRPVDATHTQVWVTISYRRGLDPSWYFGPLQNALMSEGGGHLLDMLALT